jgi:trimeric autotransporter adhesin
MFTARKLPLTLAFTVLVVVAFGVSCKGFFPNPVLQSIAIQPPSPQILLTKTVNMQAWGTYDDGTRSQITSGVAWSSDDPSVTIDPITGVATGAGLGTAGITASAQGLSGTATATVYIVITSLTVNPTTWSFKGANGGQAQFTATANGNVDVTSTATFTPSNTTFFSCPGGTTPVVCTAETGTTAGSYTIVVSYPGSTLTAPISVTVD